MAHGMATAMAGLLAAGVVTLQAPRAAADDGAAYDGRARAVRTAKLAVRPSRTSQATAPRDAAAWHARRGPWFRRNWGVDIVGIHPLSSGYMLRFDYRVVDPELASALVDRAARPYLVDEATRTALAVPAMENVGELRQVAPLEARRTYFMIFGNPGRLVKRGSRVTLVVGNLRADGLVVN